MITKKHRLSLCLLSVIICSTTYCATSNQKTLSKKILNTSQMSYQELRNASQKIFDSITDLKRKQSIQEKILNLLKKKNTDKTQNKIEVIQVEFDLNELDQDGYPTPEGLKRLLIEQYFPKNAKNIIVETFKGGTRNDTLYRVFDKSQDKQSIFFLKISKLDRRRSKNVISEQQKLEALQAGPFGRLGLDTFYYPDSTTIIPKKNLPQLVWVEKFWVYKNHKNQERTIEVTHAAKGSLVAEILKTDNQHLKDKCCRAVATAIASFQQAFMTCTDPNFVDTWTTVDHGDLQFNNILFDERTSQVYFIDNSNMQTTNNILEICPLAQTFPLKLQFIFWNAYIAAYPKNKEQVLFNYFSERINVAKYLYEN